MKRLGLVVLLLAVTADAGRFDRLNSRCQAGRSTRGLGCGDDFAFFELAPANGAGMGAACACAAITGAKGEAVTFTRTGNATCSRQGLATTGIANGDLVSCAGNLPRVEPSGGVLGLRVESARNNELARSEEIDNATWVDATVGGAAAPTLNGANSVTSPRGDLTAEDYTFPATTAAQVSGRLNPGIGSCSGVSCAQFIYVRAIGANATIDICNDKASAVRCQPCAAVTGSWTLCPIVFTGIGFDGLFIGNGSAWNGGTARGAARVAVWGAQRETSATYSTSYIPTVVTAVTRNAENASVALSFSTAAGFSLAATRADLQPVATAPSVWGIAPSLHLDASNRSQLYRTFNNQVTADIITTSGSRGVTGAPTIGPFVDLFPHRIALSVTAAGAATTISRFYEGTLNSTSAAGLTSGFTATSLFLANFTSATTAGDGIITRVCLDPDPTRCR